MEFDRIGAHRFGGAPKLGPLGAGGGLLCPCGCCCGGDCPSVVSPLLFGGEALAGGAVLPGAVLSGAE